MFALAPHTPKVAQPVSRAAQRLSGDERAVTAVEFALVALPLMALLIAILHITTTFFAQQLIETAAERGARLLMTGNAQNNKMSAATFKTNVCKSLPAFMTCSKLMIDVTVASNFAAVDTGRPTITYDGAGNPSNAWSYNAGNPGDIVVMKTMYVWDVQKGPLGFDISTLSANRRLLMSISVFKTEKY